MSAPSPRRPPRRVRLLAAVVGVAAVGVASLAVADSFDPGTPTTVVVGKPRGHAVTDRLDPSRQGQSRTRFPSQPEELWRRELTGGLDLPPVIAAEGDVVAALATPDLVRIDADGRQVWRTRLGTAAAVVAPVLTSDGSTFVVAGDGTAWSVSAGGTIRFSTELAIRTKKAVASPLALDNGTVALAGERDVMLLGHDGRVRASARLASRPVGPLMRHQRGILLATQDGAVWHWRAPTRPRKLGSLGGALEGGLMRVSDRAVIGVVDHRRVVVLDLKSGNTTLVIGDASTLVELEGPATLAPTGELLVTSVVGELFGVDAHGVVQRRVPLEPLPPLFGSDAGAPMPSIFRRLDSPPSPPLIVDPDGVVAFFRAAGKLGLLRPDGSMLTLSPRLCARPITLLPAGPGKLLAACRSGSIVLFGDPPPSDPTADAGPDGG